MINPVMVCSGTFGNGQEYSEFMDIRGLGALVTKSVTLHPRPGNPPPRLWETPSGLINSIGIENKGIERFLNEDLRFLKEYGLPVIVSISGTSIDEYVKVSELLAVSGVVRGIELNVSCPNIEGGGVEFGYDPEACSELVRRVKEGSTVPVFVKLPPLAGNIGFLAEEVERAGADVISLINTLPAMAIDVETRRSRLGTLIGGLSGPAIHPVAVHLVWSVARRVKIPIIGMGGVKDWRDAVEMFLVGARAVAVGTANFTNPQVASEIIEGIERYLRGNKIGNIGEIVGALGR